MSALFPGLQAEPSVDMTPPPRASPISICGWLYKMKKRQRAFLPAWVQRWFTVEDGRLHWYRSKSDSTSRGSIDLSKVTTVREFESGKEGVYSFVVTSADRTMLLRAVNERDLRRWVSHLRLQLDYLQGGPEAHRSRPSSGSGSTHAAFDRKDITAKTKTGFDKFIGRLDVALEHLTQLEKEVTRVNPDKELIIDERDDEEPTASNTRSRRSSSGSSSKSSNSSDGGNTNASPGDGGCVRDRASSSSKSRKVPPRPPEGAAPVRRRPSLPRKTASSEEGDRNQGEAAFAERELVDSSSGGERLLKNYPDSSREGRGPPRQGPVLQQHSSGDDRRPQQQEDGRVVGRSDHDRKNPTPPAVPSNVVKRYDSKQPGGQWGAGIAKAEEGAQFSKLQDLELVEEEDL